MSTQSVADQLVQMCREAKNADVLEQLYADNIVSREIAAAPAPLVEGKDAVRQKSEQWFASVEEFHSGTVSDPLVAGNFFSCSMSFDVTFKERGRTQMEEICVYEVTDDQIVSEQFFYSMG